MSDNELNDFFDFYSAKSTSSIFKLQLNKIKQAPQSEDVEICNTKDGEVLNCKQAIPKDNATVEIEETPLLTLSEDAFRVSTLKPVEDVVLCSDSDGDVECIEVPNANRMTGYFTRSKRQGSRPKRLKKQAATKSPKKRKKSKVKNINDMDIIIINESFETSIQEDEFNYEVPVKVLWMSTNVVKFQIRKFQKIATIYDYFAQEEKLRRDEILLTLHGVELSEGDTPDSLNISVLDFIEGGVVRNNKQNVACREEKEVKGSFIIKIQSESGTKSLSVDPKDQMKLIMIKYSEQLGKPYGTFKFMFDGTIVQERDTPLHLGLENGEILDVVSL